MNRPNAIHLSQAAMCAAMQQYLNEHVFQEDVAVDTVAATPEHGTDHFTVNLKEPEPEG